MGDRIEVFAVVALLSFFSLGLSAPLDNCDALLQPINKSKEEMLGRWHIIGGSSSIPGTRSVVHLLSSLWVDVKAGTESNSVKMFQTQKIFGQCSSLTFEMTFENSTMFSKQPLDIEDIFLPTDCADCVVAKEIIVSGNDVFNTLYLAGRRRSVSQDALTMLKKQAECLRMPPPLLLDTKSEICPDDIEPFGGLNAVHDVLQAKLGHLVAALLDVFFDVLVN